jgi:hypothetical protein
MVIQCESNQQSAVPTAAAFAKRAVTGAWIIHNARCIDRNERELIRQYRQRLGRTVATAPARGCAKGYSERHSISAPEAL